MEALPEELCSLGPYGRWALCGHSMEGLRVGVPPLIPDAVLQAVGAAAPALRTT